MLGDDPHKPPSDFNPYAPGVDAHLPERVVDHTHDRRASGATDPRAMRSVVLGGIAAGFYFLPPVGVVLGVIAMIQGKRFLDDWNEDHRFRGRGAAIAGRAMGIGSIIVAVLMVLYYLWIYFQIVEARAPDLPY